MTTVSTVILAEGSDVSFWESPGDLAASVEPTEVRSGAYQAWSADGFVVSLDAPPAGNRGPVSARISGQRDTEGLRAKLLELAELLGIARSQLEAAPLGQLVDALVSANARFRAEHTGPIRRLLERAMPPLFRTPGEL